MEDKSCTCTDDCATGFNPLCSCRCGECACGDIANMIGKKRARLFRNLCESIARRYGTAGIWKRLKVKTKKWQYEYKFSMGGKTLCGFYIADHCLGFMIVLGKKERASVEDCRQEFSEAFLSLYDGSKTHHDGKWLMAELNDSSLFGDLLKTLAIKRKPSVE